MRNGRGEGASKSGKVFLEPWVVGVDEFVSVAVEDHPALIQDEKLCAVIDTATGNRFYLARLLVETVSGQKEGVLQAVGDQQRLGVAYVALLNDQVEDRFLGCGLRRAGGGVCR